MADLLLLLVDLSAVFSQRLKDSVDVHTAHFVSAMQKLVTNRCPAVSPRVLDYLDRPNVRPPLLSKASHSELSILMYIGDSSWVGKFPGIRDSIQEENIDEWKKH